MKKENMSDWDNLMEIHGNDADKVREQLTADGFEERLHGSDGITWVNNENNLYVKEPLDDGDVNYIKKTNPKTYEGFQRAINDAVVVFATRQRAYGSSNIGLGVPQPVEKADIKKSVLGISIRLNDKVNRLVNLMMTNQEPKDETIDDTLIDVINYGIIAMIVRSGKWGQ